MKNHLHKIYVYAKGILFQLKRIFLELPRNKKIVVIIVSSLIIIVIVRAIVGGTDDTEKIAPVKRSVTVRSVSDISNKETSIPLLGIVTSTSEATIRAESSGKLTRVYKKLGDTVYAGAVLAEFENSSERAQVLQAEGAYDAAKASKDITRINNTTVGSSLMESKTAALNTISSAYNTMDDGIHTKTDSFFNSPRAENARFELSVPDASLVYSIESTRVTIEKILTARNARNRTLTVASDLITELTTIQKEAEIIKTYLDDLATAYSKALESSSYSQAQIEAGKISVGIARSSLSGTLSSITSMRSSLIASTNAETITGTTGGGGSTATADAQVKQALGSYNAALSRLEKTVVRSPITGTLNSFSIKTGDFITQFTEVAVVSNNGALEVVSYVTEEDARRIQVGAKVRIDNSVTGSVTRVAQALDPRTKKMEIRVGITDRAASLTNGQSVRMVITKNNKVTKVSNATITIPLSALKLTPTGAFVFTVDASSTLIAVPVKEGAILGEEIQILSGLFGSEEIVLDARGLKAGTVVTVTPQN